LTNDNGEDESLQWVPPAAILEKQPIRATVTAVGDGWLETEFERHEGWVYIAAGVWCGQFVPELDISGKAGAAFAFQGERPGSIHSFARGRQAIAFVRDAGFTHFSDGTAERDYTDAHEQATLQHAAALGLTDTPVKRFWGYRPYTPGGPVFRRLGERTWLATGGRKMGTILGASFACRLVDEELRA
jgi:hypothetical protein